MTDALRIVVVGGGIAGLVAAREAAASGATVTHVVGCDVMGGLVANVGALANFAGGGVTGIDLATTLFTDATDLGVEPMMEDAVEIRVAGAGLLVIGETAIPADCVIIATGARLRHLAVPGATELLDRGVSYCGWCDGPLHRDKPVIVVGGGDAAFQEALHLASITSHVTVLIRGEATRADPAYVEEARATPNLALSFGQEVIAVLGDEAVSGVRIRDRASGAERDIAASGVFPFIGLEPATCALPKAVLRAANGAVITNERFETAVPGLFAVGAVRSGYPGLLDDAIDEARRAVDHALRRPD